MRRWDAAQVAHAAGARLLHGEVGSGPDRVVIDSRQVGPGALFVGLPGEHVDGGRFAAAALEQGAWGVLVGSEHAAGLSAPGPAGPGADQTVIAAADPLLALQRLARCRRRELGEAGARVIGVTGSTGKTSTKDLIGALVSPHRRTVVTQANFNTEIGLPLQILAAPDGTELLVLEMAMRGRGQIAELCEIAEPDLGVIVNIGPVHLELLGSIEAIAATKSELIAALPAHGVAIVPAGERLLAPHLRADILTLSFGASGDVHYLSQSDDRVEIAVGTERVSLELDFVTAHLRENLLAAVAAAHAAGVAVGGRLEFELASGRGGHVTLPDEIELIDGSYNANPMSMRAAVDELDATAGGAPRQRRRVAVLGGMLELGPAAGDFHRRLGEYATGHVDLLVTVGELAAGIAEGFDGEHVHAADAAAAAAIVPTLLHGGDVVLVKGSLGIGLRAVAEALTVGAPA